jgi:sugar lactone lactonase YvrE
MAPTPLLKCAEVASVFCGGILSPYRFNHPEGVMIDPKDGAVWCGGEAGELYRIAPDGSSATVVGNSGGFALGLCMDRQRRIYMCDIHHQCVIVFDEQGNELNRLFGQGGEHRLEIPNYAVLSQEERYLYVSNTCRAGGPGIWRFDLEADLETDTGSLWMRETCYSANGLALAPDGSGLYLVESHLPGVSFVPIREDGTAGKKQTAVLLPHDEPDGLAFNSKGELFISIYHPTRIYRFIPASGKLELVLQDDSTDLIHHSTNLAFRSDTELFSANLGAWHITRIQLPDTL